MNELIDWAYSLNDWNFTKGSANNTCVELYLCSKNENMYCRAILPKCSDNPTYVVFIAMANEFDGNWSNSRISQHFTTIQELSDFMGWVDTDMNLSEMDGCEDIFKIPYF
jgi:hypothetical protein